MPPRNLSKSNFYLYFPWAHCSNSHILESPFPLKLVVLVRMQPRELHCCHMKSRNEIDFRCLMCLIFPRATCFVLFVVVVVLLLLFFFLFFFFFCFFLLLFFGGFFCCCFFIIIIIILNPSASSIWILV